MVKQPPNLWKNSISFEVTRLSASTFRPSCPFSLSHTLPLHKAPCHRGSMTLQTEPVYKKDGFIRSFCQPRLPHLSVMTTCLSTDIQSVVLTTLSLPDSSTSWVQCLSPVINVSIILAFLSSEVRGNTLAWGVGFLTHIYRMLWVKSQFIFRLCCLWQNISYPNGLLDALTWQK